MLKTKNNILLEKETGNNEKQTNSVDYYVKFSFVITYILLFTTATITFVEAIRTPFPEVRHILNLETCISIVAGYFYSIFVGKIESFSQSNKEINWADISETRYIDWCITTPMMLLVLCLVLGQHTNIHVRFPVIGSIFILNYIMLYFGYIGESKMMDRTSSMISGFFAFFAMFLIIFITFVRPKYSLANYILFGIYLVVWSLYGIVYMWEEEYKNIAMNILDLIAKCFIGLGLWAYYTKLIYP
jgi:bacteriorhodopsin